MMVMNTTAQRATALMHTLHEIYAINCTTRGAEHVAYCITCFSDTPGLHR